MQIISIKKYIKRLEGDDDDNLLLLVFSAPGLLTRVSELIIHDAVCLSWAAELLSERIYSSSSMFFQLL